MIDILVISHACFTAINRNIYSLFLKDNYKIEIVVPKILNFPSGPKEANPQLPENPPIHFLSLIGNNPRIYYFEGLIELLNTKRPKIIILDNDPVSRMALKVGEWSKQNNAQLFCLSCENLSLKLIDTYKRRGIKSIPSAIAKRILLNRTKKVINGVFTINTDGQQLFKEEGYKNVVHIPLGFDPNYFNLDNNARLRIRNELGLKYIVVAYFGRLIKEKGIHILIKALESLKEYNWHLMMDDFDAYSTGYAQEIQELLKKANIMDRVVFIKPNHFEISAFMNASDVVVVPSISTTFWKEQYGRVAAEALACGRIVIASNSGALPELLGGKGILFPEGDVNQLTEILKELVSNQSTIDINNSSESIANYAFEKLSINRQKHIMENCFQLTLPN